MYKTKEIYRYLIVVVIATFAAALISGPIITFAIPNRSNEPGANCYGTGKQSSNGAALFECCWIETVPPGTGHSGGDYEQYCSTCEDGGTRGMINCSDPELTYNKKPLTSDLGGFPKGGVLEHPETSDKRGDLGNSDIDGIIVEQPETSSNEGDIGNVPLNGEVLRE